MDPHGNVVDTTTWLHPSDNQPSPPVMNRKERRKQLALARRKVKPKRKKKRRKNR